MQDLCLKRIAIARNLNKGSVRRAPGFQDRGDPDEAFMTRDAHFDGCAILHHHDDGTDTLFHEVDGVNRLSRLVQGLIFLERYTHQVRGKTIQVCCRKRS